MGRRIGRFRVEGGRMVSDDSEEALEALLDAASAADLGRVWQRAYARGGFGPARAMTHVQLGILRQFARACSSEPDPDWRRAAVVVAACLLDWAGFVDRVRSEVGRKHDLPTTPNLAFLSAYVQQAIRHVDLRPAERAAVVAERHIVEHRPAGVSAEDRARLLREAEES